MVYELQKLKNEYIDYKKKHIATPKQVDLIKRKYRQYQAEKAPRAVPPLIQWIQQTIDYQIEDLTQLHRFDVEKILYKMDKSLLAPSPATIDYIFTLTGIGKDDLSTLSSVLKRNILCIEDLTRLDYYKIINHPKYNLNYCLLHFNIRVSDTIIKSNIDFEYGYQNSTLCQDNRLYYIKFFNLLTLDYDHKDLDSIKQNISQAMETFCFYIYETYQGYHLYYMVEPFSHSNLLSTQLMKELGCDPWYIVFSYKNGYKTRLSKKVGRDETFISRKLEKWGKGEEHPQCRQMIDTLDQYI